MKRNLWLLAVLLSIASISVIAGDNPTNASAGGAAPQISCQLPKPAQVSPGREVSISCTNLPKDPKVKVVLKRAKDQTESTPPVTVQNGIVNFPGPIAGIYAVALTIDSKTIQVPGQLELSPPTTTLCKLPHVAPGEEVMLTECSAFSGDQRDVPISLTSGEGKIIPANDGVSKDKTLTFKVPSDTKPGQYSLTADNKPIQGQLDVMGPVAVDAIYPLTTYSLQKGFNFTISGKNFSTAPKGNLIEVIDQGMLGECKHVPPDADNTPCVSPPGTTSSENLSPGTTTTSTTEIVVEGFYPKHYYGAVRMIVHVGDSKSAPASVTFAPVSQQGVVLAAAAVFFVVAYVLYRLVTKGLKGDIVDGVKPTPWTSLFLDRETNSYSLSKFQVIAWTAVTVYSYVYLFLCRTLIQGDFRFPDVSQNLPQLFFVSAGTTVAAAAITATVGSKGAGSIQPSPADFISTGGLVAGDRFQFFTWTLVGCIGYVYLVIRMNPETPNISLPDIPQNFLYLMGVSSAGYLGGKLVRKPGPVIKVLSVAKVTPPSGTATVAPATPLTVSITSSGAPAASGPDRFQLDARAALGDYKPQDPAIKVAFPVLTLNLKGENLDPTGKIKVDDQPLRGDMFWINGQRDPQSLLCSDISVSLNDASQYIDGTKVHTLMLVNTDGQSATMSFPIDPMSIEPISGVTAGTAAIDVPVTGKSFVDGMKFEWRNPADAKDASASGTANYKSVTQLIVSFVPGTTAGTGKLTLISPVGLRGGTMVSVTAPPMIIDPVTGPKAGTTPVDVRVTGKNLVDLTKFEWRNPATAQQPNATGNATYKSATELVVNLIPGTTIGTGKLTLIGPTGVQASVSVTVS